MQTRRGTALVLLLIVVIALLAPAAAGSHMVLGQTTENDQGDDATPATEGEEAEGEEAEGDEAEGDEAGAAEEAGPPWTYQMARMTIALVIFLALAIAGAYYRFVVVRQRGEV